MLALLAHPAQQTGRHLRQVPKLAPVLVLVLVLVPVLVLVLVPVPVPVLVLVLVPVPVLVLALVVTTTGRWTPRSTRVVCKPACLLQLAATGSGATRTSTDLNLACRSPLATQ